MRKKKLYLTKNICVHLVLSVARRPRTRYRSSLSGRRRI